MYEHIRNTLSHSKHVPYFEVSTERNVSVVVGQTSHLNCTVRDLGDRTVSTSASKNSIRIKSEGS